LNYRWPGNIRELQNVFEAMFALSDGNLLDASQLPLAIANAGVEPLRPAPQQVVPITVGRLEEMQRQAVLAAIANAYGNMSMAARALGISRSTLYVKLAAIRAQSGSSGSSH